MDRKSPLKWKVAGDRDRPWKLRAKPALTEDALQRKRQQRDVENKAAATATASLSRKLRPLPKIVPLQRPPNQGAFWLRHDEDRVHTAASHAHDHDGAEFGKYDFKDPESIHEILRLVGRACHSLPLV